jgi:hypothetical protein
MLSHDRGAGANDVLRCRVETTVVDSARHVQIAFLNGPLFLPRIGSTIALGPPLRAATVRSTHVSLPRRRAGDTTGQAVAVAIVDVDDPGPPDG